MASLLEHACDAPGCERAFASVRALEIHRAEVHAGAQTYPARIDVFGREEEHVSEDQEHRCTDCERTFDSPQGLSLHRTRVHGGGAKRATGTARKVAGGGMAVKTKWPRRPKPTAQGNGTGEPELIITVRAELAPDKVGALTFEQIARFARETGATITITPVLSRAERQELGSSA